MKALSASRVFINISKFDLLKSNYVRHVFIFILSFMFCKSALFSSIYPIGFSFISVLDINYLPVGTLGGVLGSVFIGDFITSIKYITLLLIMSTCKWLFYKILNAKNIVAINMISIIVSMVLSEVANFLYMPLDSRKITMFFIEIALSLSLSILFLKIVNTIKSNTFVSTVGFIYISIAVSIFLCCLDNVVNLKISIASVIISYLFLSLSHYLSGIKPLFFAGVACFLLSLFDQDRVYMSTSLIFYNVVCIMLDSKNKSAQSLLFLIVNLVSYMPFINNRNLYILSEPMISVLLFIFIPIKRLEIFNYSKSVDLQSNHIQGYVNQNLISMASSLDTMSNQIIDFNQKIDLISKNDISSIYSFAIENVCSKCKNKMYCTTSGYNILYDSFNKLGHMLLKGETLSVNESNHFIKSVCKNPNGIINSLNDSYSLFLKLRDNNRKINAYKQNIVEHFSFISNAVKNLGYSLNDIDYIDIEMGENVKEFLDSSKIRYNSIYVVCEKSLSMVLNINIPKSDIRQKDLRFLKDEVSRVCKIDFDMPVIMNIKEEMRIIFLPKGNFVTNSYIYQIPKNANELNGDNASIFNDMKGNANLIICDGMGTGEKANLESKITLNIAENLIKAGIDYENSISILNSALMSKNGDECFSTIDMSSINKYTGKMTLIKAGAVHTYIRKDGVVSSIETQSMPVGILPNVRYSKNQVYLKENNVVVMVSDGAISSGDVWIKSVIDTYKGKSAKELAMMIGDNAKLRNEKDYADDITVIVSFIERA